MDGHGDDGEVAEEVFLPADAMDTTALAHATSSRFIRFSSPQIDGSTVRAQSVLRGEDRRRRRPGRDLAVAAHARERPRHPSPQIHGSGSSNDRRSMYQWRGQGPGVVMKELV